MTRIKTVFSRYEEVAHLWAHQQQEEGKCRSLYFQGRSIYSYGGHFEIARITRDLHGNELILFNNNSYSRTTEVHKHAVRMAIPRHMPVIGLPSGDYMQELYREKGEYILTEYVYGLMLKLMRHYCEEFVRLIGLRKRARVNDYHSELCATLACLRNVYLTYGLYGGQKMRVYAPKSRTYRVIKSEPIIDYMLSPIKNSSNYWPADTIINGKLPMGGESFYILKHLVDMGFMNVVTKDGGRPTFEQESVGSKKEIDELCLRILGEEESEKKSYKERLDKVRKELEKSREKEARAKEKYYEEQLNKWLQGEDIPLHRLYTYRDKYTYTRLEDTDSGKVVVTSRGMSLSIEMVKRVYSLITNVKNGLKKGETWECKGSIQITTLDKREWEVNSIDYSGELVAGCHIVSFKEASRIINLINSL